jgi:1-deoxy-D-xylulose-5-phosphate reductoisomerase
MPDMRLPIAYALTYPDRARTSFGAIDWTSLHRLDFDLPDRSTFRCLDLAYVAGRLGGNAPAWLSAANEVAVDAFLAGRIRWADIATVVESSLEHHADHAMTPRTVEEVVQTDQLARRITHGVLNR